jgi:protein phosphatase
VGELNVLIGHYGHSGQKRDHNEDSYLVLTAPAIAPELDTLLVVADGMGGHRAGDVASRMLVELLIEQFSSSAYRQRVAYSPEHPDYYIVVLKDALEWANERLYHTAAAHSHLSGMGTTATVLLFVDHHVFWGHIGDSRAYLLRDHRLRQLTHDHTWVSSQVSAGLLSEEEACTHPRRNVLTQSLGGSPLIRVDRGMSVVRPGDKFLICSDGLSGLVSDAELQSALLTERSPQTTCQHLGHMANQRGGPDNITVLIGQLTQEPVQPPQHMESGCLIGPVEAKSDNQSSDIDTLKLPSQKKPRLSALSKQLGKWILLFMVALFVGGSMLWVGSSCSSPLMWAAVAGEVIFVIGALLGWLLK